MREQSLFIGALEKEDPAERAAFLDQACAGDPALRVRIEQLLLRHEQTGDPLDVPLPPTVDGPVYEGPGTVIGPYKLVQEIGEGGMGTVWMAQQSAPIRRLVALKVIKAGMDSKQVLARFEAERQALALMDHPSIARVLDAGAAPGGRPFFVMELVKGVPLTKYCDEQRLTPKQRLELFVPVCQAIQHAHQKGIIHRDVKPSNVLVALYDGRPVPKVIDFGIAKATGHRLTEHTAVTGFGTVVGTLEYMSPEQAELNQLDIDTRSDIYSLGVLLYELLTGSPPFTKKELEKAGMLEMLRVIREQEPSKPSTKLSTADGLPTLAANRGTEPAKLTKLVRGDLDWIVMKALEKDRNRRYESANGMAADVLRYLADEPVHAGPASARYRLRKFVRRHRGAVLATGIVLAVLLAGVVVSTWQAIRATRSEAAERRSATVARAINRYLIEDLLDAATPDEAQGRKITVEEVLDRAAIKVDTAFPDEPEVEAGVRLAIGRAYLSLSLYGKADPHLRRALELREVHLGVDHADTLEAMQQVGWLCAYQGKFDEAEHLHSRALDGLRRAHGNEHPAVLAQMYNLGWVLAERHQHDRAEPIFRECFEMQRRVLGEEHPDTLETMDKLTQVIIHQSRWREAEPLANRCLEIKQRVLGDNSPATLDARRTVYMVLKVEGKWLEAERLCRENLTAAVRIFPPNHRETLLYKADLGSLCLHLGRFSDAERELRECRDGLSQTVGATHDQSLSCASQHSLSLLELGKLHEAEQEAREALKAMQAKGTGPGQHSYGNLARLGKVLCGRGKWAEGEKCLNEAVQGIRGLNAADEEYFLRAVKHEHAAALWALGRRDQARVLMWQVLDERRRALPPDHPDLARSLYDCGRYLAEVGQPRQSQSLLDEALRIQREALPPQHPAIGQSLVALGSARASAGDLAEGDQLLREGLEVVVKALPKGHWFPADAQGRLGDCLMNLNRFDEAEPLLLGSHEKLDVAAGPPPARRIEALERLVRFCQLTGQKEKAAAWQLKLAAVKDLVP
jgi:serine/threonine protein kinase